MAQRLSEMIPRMCLQNGRKNVTNSRSHRDLVTGIDHTHVTHKRG